tara:strand:+ start:129 stop:659 length:531 start_codon:yes stop_codon:yes gene_type:complete
LSRAWTKIIDTQLKDFNSTQLMKLGQLTYVDPNARTELEQLDKLKEYASFLQSPGQGVFSDSLKLSNQTANANAKTFKPSNIYDTETFASTYLLEIIGVGATTTGGDTASIAIQLTDGSSTLTLLKPTNVTASGPLTFEPTSPLYINESNYLSINNLNAVDSVVTVYCAIVSRGGA